MLLNRQRYYIGKKRGTLMYQYNSGGFFYVLDSYVGKLIHITSQLLIEKLSGICAHILSRPETFIRPESGCFKKVQIPLIICPISRCGVDG